MSDTILEQLPTPLFLSLQMLEEEKEQNQPFRAVHRLIDAIEVFCKLHTVTAVSQFVTALGDRFDEFVTDEERQKQLDKMRTMLASGLKTLSLGIWWGFAKHATEVLKLLEEE